jgi:zinc D-Ala-D-Ala carboxypeptidase
MCELCYTTAMKKRLIIAGIIVLVVVGGFAAYSYFSNQNKPASQTNGQPVARGFDKSQHPTDEPGGIWWVVNKKRPLPKDYEPASLSTPNIKLRWAPIAESMQVSSTIAQPLEEMHKVMTAAGFDVMLISGFRSEKTQAELYNGYVAASGQEEADRLSAKPGTSEHQTGLVVDLGRSDNKCELEQCFGELPEGKWLAEHAHEYGFIVRYPQGKEAVVGYMYEPWHVRYVGKELAAELHKTNQTMEEFFGL